MRPRSTLFVLAALLSSAGGRADGQIPASWPTYQGNPRHSGYVPATFDVTRFALRWSVPLSTLPVHQVAAGEHRVFASVSTYHADVTALFAVDTASGSLLWSKSFGPVSRVNPPALAGNAVYLQTGKSTGSIPPLLRAFDAASGDFLFQQQFEAQWESYLAPTIDGGVVYANGGYYGGMYAFDASSPLTLWFLPLNQYDEWTPALDPLYAYAYTGEYSPRLSIVDRLTGIEVRSIPDPGFSWNGWSMDLAPALGDHDDVLAIQGERLISFDLATDSIRYEIGPAFFTGQVAVAHDLIFAIHAGALTVWDELTGRFRWSWATQEPLIDAMIVTDRQVVARTADTTYLIDLASHQAVWSYPASGRLAWCDDTLFLAGDDGWLTAIDAPAALFADGFETGDTGRWSSTVP